jgi:hypothetical protein
MTKRAKSKKVAKKLDFWQRVSLGWKKFFSHGWR